MTAIDLALDGWRQLAIFPSLDFIFIKGSSTKGVELLYSSKHDDIKITKVWKVFQTDHPFKRQDVFIGECKDIETLNLLSNLIKIDKMFDSNEKNE